MRLTATALVASGVIVIMACNTLSAQDEVPAVLVEPSEAAQAELREAISTTLNGREVTLSETALTHESELIIQRVVRRDSRGLPLTGRDFEKPDHFTLMKSAEQCVLVHRESGRRIPLRSATCKPVVQ